MFLKKVKDTFKRKPKAKTNGHNSIIGNITVAGDITGDIGDNLLINGVVLGSVRLATGDNSTITIGVNGKILCDNEKDGELNDLIADHIIIYGSVLANKIEARYSLSVMSTAQVTAKNILYGSLSVNEGAMITGYLRDEHGG